MQTQYELRLRQMLKLHEGYSLVPYTDTKGHPTIGVGHNLDAAHSKIGVGRDLTRDGLSDQEVEQLLDNDILQAEVTLYARFAWFERLDEVRRAVLTDMNFNMGIGKLAKFHLMLAACEQGDYDETAAEMVNSEWHHEVGARALRLEGMMRSGEWYTS